jgi:hypothetical protein
VTLYAYAFGEHNCGHSRSDWYWAGVGGTSDPITIVEPAAGLVPMVTPGPSRTPAVPTAITTSSILFAPGATQATVEGYLPANATQRYVMHVAAGQYVAMDAAVGMTGQGLCFSIVGADGTVMKPMGDAHVRVIVPSAQDYTVELVSDVGTVNYQMSVLIPVRVRFAPGTTSAQVDGSLTADGVRHYVLRAGGPADDRCPRHYPRPGKDGHLGRRRSGASERACRSPSGGYDGVLPLAQDYLIAVQAEGGTGANYVLEITMPPL